MNPSKYLHKLYTAKLEFWESVSFDTMPACNGRAGKQNKKACSSR